MVRLKTRQRCLEKSVAPCSCWLEASRPQDYSTPTYRWTEILEWINSIALLKPGSIAIWVSQVSVLGSCPVHFWVLSSPPGLYLLDARAVPQLWKPKMFWGTDKCSLGDKKLSLATDHFRIQAWWWGWNLFFHNQQQRTMKWDINTMGLLFWPPVPLLPIVFSRKNDHKQFRRGHFAENWEHRMSNQSGKQFLCVLKKRTVTWESCSYL